MNEYVLTVGLEIHAELATQSKMWCGCKNDPDETRPNVNICPVCMAHPGTLPVINKEAVKKVIQVGTALGGTIARDFTEFDRKNYFYPDIPKGYQLSQYKYPLVAGGELNGIKLTRIHLEEDTGTSIHDQGDHSLVNYNRAGVPLMELVTEPVIKSAKQAGDFGRELQLLLQYLGAGQANMEKGEMRVEANISVSKDPNKFGTKVEVKNINSFKAVEKAIEFEMARHIAMLENGEEIKQETRGWDEDSGVTFSQRSKENAHDYRYFPDPDLPKLKLALLPEFSEEEIRKSLPELPWDIRDKYINKYKIKSQDVEIFVLPENLFLRNLFEGVIKQIGTDEEVIKLSGNYIISTVLGFLRDSDKSGSQSNLRTDYFIKVMIMIKNGKLSSNGAKDVLKLMYEKGGDPENIAKEKGLIQVSDTGALEKVIDTIISNNEKVVLEYKAGKVASLQFLLGQAMKETKGSANPGMLKELFVRKLS